MTLSLEEIMENGIYFHSFGETHSYVSCCLADGLDQLGVPLSSNIDYYEPTYTSLIANGTITISKPKRTKRNRFSIKRLGSRSRRDEVQLSKKVR